MPANAADGAACEFRDDHGARDALAQGLLSESVDGIRLASELVADRNAGANLSRLADELTALSAGCAPVASESRVLD